MLKLKDESLVAVWQSFFEENCKSEIDNIVLEYPENRSLIVDYWDIDKADPKLTEILINQPYKTIFNAEEALKQTKTSFDRYPAIRFRVENLPEEQRISIGEVGSIHLGKLIAITGEAKGKTEIQPKI
ncbi:unnamed protein product, partial [marine sediment metagenome]